MQLLKFVGQVVNEVVGASLSISVMSVKESNVCVY